MPGFVGLIAGQGRGLVFVWEAFKHSNVHEVVIANLNLEGESGVRGQVQPLTPAPLWTGLCEKGLDVGEPCPFRSSVTGLMTFPSPSFKCTRRPGYPSDTLAPHTHSIRAITSPRGSVLSPRRLACAHTGTHTRRHIRSRGHKPLKQGLARIDPRSFLSVFKE